MSEEVQRPWYRELNGYHWFVLIVCTLGWSFDCANQQLFNLGRRPAMIDLLKVSPNDPVVNKYTTLATSLLLIGWATGGLICGVMGDRLGRVKTMAFSILAYSLFAGLNGFVQELWQFLTCLFLAATGVGGQFAVGVTLVAESLPDKARPRALGMLQAFSAFGNIGAGLIGLGLAYLFQQGVITTQWRWLFGISAIPALLAVPVIRYLKEPEAWRKSRAERKSVGMVRSTMELFQDPRWRRHAIVGLFLASAGVIGLWGIGVFSYDLNQSIFRKDCEAIARKDGEAKKDQEFIQQIVASPEELTAVAKELLPKQLLGLEPKNNDTPVIYTAAMALQTAGRTVSATSILAELDKDGEGWKAQTKEERVRREEFLAAPAGKGSVEENLKRIKSRQESIAAKVARSASITLVLFNIGAFFGIYIFARVTQVLGRRPTFVLGFLGAMISTSVAFLYMKTWTDQIWMVPLMGCFQLSVFGGYAIYFPELFPTRLRSTGTSFCYNIARYVAAAGPMALGWLTTVVYVNQEEPMRYAGVTMCAAFLVGMIVIWFGPETKGKPLPE